MSLDLGDVHEPGAAAGEAAAGEGQLGDALEAALVQRAGAVTYPRPPLEGGRDGRVRLVLLEGLEGVQVGVVVVQPDDEAHRHQVVVRQVVQERAAVLRGLF